MVRRRAVLTLSLAAASVVGAVVALGCDDTQGPSPISWPEQPPPDGGPIMGEGKPFGPQPVFGTAVTAAVPPAPLSGGTLLVTADGKTAVAADPDRDRVFFVDLASKMRVGELALNPGDEPGRVVEDGAGRVHVVLRRGGAVVSIDVASRAQLARRDVCAAPRGIAYDAASDTVHVACAGGDLVTLPAAGGAATAKRNLGRDLRDVVVAGGKLWVTRFRTAALLEVRTDGVAATFVPPTAFGKPSELTPSVAWRAIPLGEGVAMVHQRGRLGPVQTSPGGYGGDPCSGIVQSAVTVFGATGPSPQASPSIFGAVLPVDVAASKDGQKLAVVAAGNAYVSMPKVFVVRTADLATSSPCGGPTEPSVDVPGEPTSVQYDDQGNVVVQSREPAALFVVSPTGDSVKIELSSDSRKDTGFAVFHANAGGQVACASCHPEGGDDARTWTFEGIGPRRTQTFRGGLLGSEPFHWDGDMSDLRMLMSQVFVGRMSGPLLDEAQLGALVKWIDHIPVLPASTTADAATVARGKALYENAEVGCAGCHGGPRLTNNATVNVGTGGAFQVPSLKGIAWRAPFIHTGCAPTLADRFGSCGGGDAHGKTSHLAPAQIADLVAYLETL